MMPLRMTLSDLRWSFQPEQALTTVQLCSAAICMLLFARGFRSANGF